MDGQVTSPPCLKRGEASLASALINKNIRFLCMSCIVIFKIPFLASPFRRYIPPVFRLFDCNILSFSCLFENDECTHSPYCLIKGQQADGTNTAVGEAHKKTLSSFFLRVGFFLFLQELQNTECCQ